MKAHALAGLALTIQVIFPVAAISDDDSKWASQRDPLADFCNNFTGGLSKLFNGESGAQQGDAADWGTKRGGWNFAQTPKNANQNIVIIESNKKVTESKNVSIKSVDGSRMIRRFGPNEKNNVNVKKMIDSGSSSYNLGSYGASRYYPIGSSSGAGYHSGGGGMRGSSFGAYGDPTGSMNPYGGGYTSYGFGSGSGSAGRGGGGYGRAVSAGGSGSSRSF